MGGIGKYDNPGGKNSGGYNGGGIGSGKGGGGGGATHISFSNGELYKLKINDIAIVSGGGGGGAYTNGYNCSGGGSGGGLTGGNGNINSCIDTSANGYGTGGSQTKGGSSSAKLSSNGLSLIHI